MRRLPNQFIYEKDVVRGSQVSRRNFFSAYQIRVTTGTIRARNLFNLESTRAYAPDSVRLRTVGDHRRGPAAETRAFRFNPLANFKIGASRSVLTPVSSAACATIGHDDVAMPEPKLVWSGPIDEVRSADHP
jgi:hypothetical protein